MTLSAPGSHVRIPSPRISVFRRAAIVLAVALAACLALPAAAAEGDGKPTVTVDFPEGGLTIRSGDNSLSLGVWGQLRWTGTDRQDYDADSSGTSGFGDADPVDNEFSIPRFRVYLQGSVWKKWLKYKLEYELSNTSNSQGSNKIKDGFVEAALRPEFAVRFGQFKTPFGLQELTPDIRLEFQERAITDAKFTSARDMGVAISGTTPSKAVGWSAGVFNGGGESRSQDDVGLLYVGRAWFDPLGEYKLSETAVENPDKMILHLGAAARTGELARGTATSGVYQNPNNETAYGAEFAWRLKRMWATAEYFRMNDEQGNPVSGPTIHSAGWHAQFGYLVTKSLELAVRYARINPDRSVVDDDLAEARAGVNYYWKGHNLKLQWDVGFLEYDAGYSGLGSLATRNLPALGTRLGPPQTYTDWQSRFQMQFAF